MNFILGCNYWASHAGTEMWRKWDESIVRSDLEQLAAHGVSHLRVFPNWRDFQPVKPSYGCLGALVEYVMEDDKYFDNPYYLDSTMVARFGRFCEIAAECGCKLIVGLVTGWMSGRLFIPSALYGKDLFRDPTALILQQKYCKGLVTALKDYPSILAWDLGNECNCMCEADSRDTAANWTAIISNAIRAVDSSRPIVSGMHSINLDGPWTIMDQAEHTDILTTHPYPHWVPCCEENRIGSIRTLLHATAESVYYKTVGGKPCLVEEIGTMGPMICDDETAGNFLRVNLFSNWANGQAGVMWWCAHEQSELNTAPYTWNMCERELGMLTWELHPKPVLLEMKKFSEFLKSLPYELPQSRTDGVCILSKNQEHWPIAYMTYVLAKQAGVSITFCDAKSSIPDAPYYLLPSINARVMNKEQYDTLKEKVRAGARLYISNNFGFLTEFSQFTGLHIKDSENARENGEMEFEGSTLAFTRQRRFVIEAVEAEVIACDNLGMPCFTVQQYGKGEVYYLNFPLEKMLSGMKDGFETEYFRIYRRFFRNALAQRTVVSENPYVGVTEHPAEDGVYAVLVNYSGKAQHSGLRLGKGCRVARADYGNPEKLAPYEAAVVYLTNR